jgi:hypothetical protein
VSAPISFENGIELSDAEEGVLVRQYADAYVARGWRMAPATTLLVETAIASGLRWMIRHGHPQAHARWPSRKGRVYLAFSPTRDGHWALAIDTFDEKRMDFTFAAFNGKYHQQFVDRGVRFDFERRNRSAGHMIVTRADVFPIIRMMPTFDHSVLTLGRNAARTDAFVTEYDIQRALLFGWTRTPFGAAARIIGDEVPIDAGANPRRIDILARQGVSGPWLVIEVKRAEARVSAVQQIREYLTALAFRDDPLPGAIQGILVAERIPDPVRYAAREADIPAYEISFPLTLRRVA